jgi:hypothetical protein
MSFLYRVTSNQIGDVLTLTIGETGIERFVKAPILVYRAYSVGRDSKCHLLVVADAFRSRGLFSGTHLGTILRLT